MQHQLPVNNVAAPGRGVLLDNIAAPGPGKEVFLDNIAAPGGSVLPPVNNVPAPVFPLINEVVAPDRPPPLLQPTFSWLLCLLTKWRLP
jgi:hypothetical protein